MKSAASLFRRIDEVSTVRLLLFFTVLDLIAVVLGLLHEEDVLPSRIFRLAKDRGVAEICQYVKFAVILRVLVQQRRLRPARITGAWIVLFGVMLADDAIGIHEEVGGLLMRWIEFPAPNGMRAKDLAEAVVFAGVEGTALAYVAGCYLRAPPDLRRYSRQLAMALLPLVVCGLILDNVHVRDVEQYGEMASMSVLLGFVHGRWRASARSRGTPGRSVGTG